MKTILLSVIAAITCAAAAPSTDKVEAGPRKGRLIRMEKSNVEFVLGKDRFATLAFYDAALKQQPPAAQIITVVAEPDQGKKTIQFTRKGNLFVSKEQIPAGDGYNIFLTAQEAASAPAKTIRINVDLSVCGGCKNAEYVCTCGQ